MSNKKTENFYSIKFRNLSQKFNALQKERDELEEKNERLCTLFEKKMKMAKPLVHSDLSGISLDLLKCLYIQTQHIESTATKSFQSIHESDDNSLDINDFD